MSKILILHASHDGQTEAVAERIADRLAKEGHRVNVCAAGSPRAAQEIRDADGIIVGGSIRFGRFARSLVRIVRRRAFALASRPSAFFSVSLSAVKDTEPAFACMTRFEAKTGWFPENSAAFAGALRYTRYPAPLRFVMRQIARANGAATDTSRDYEYTDWAKVDRFAAAFGLQVASRRAA